MSIDIRSALTVEIETLEAEVAEKKARLKQLRTTLRTFDRGEKKAEAVLEGGRAGQQGQP